MNQGALPPAVGFKYQNDTIYFSETIAAQLLPNGSGFGTFNSKKHDRTLGVRTREDDRDAQLEDLTVDPTKANVEPGSILR
jgi:hypothetical protein